MFCFFKTPQKPILSCNDNKSGKKILDLHMDLDPPQNVISSFLVYDPTQQNFLKNLLIPFQGTLLTNKPKQKHNFLSTADTYLKHYMDSQVNLYCQMISEKCATVT